MPDLDYIRLVGRLGLVVGDGSDSDELPDTLWCDQGTVRITPINTYTKVAGGSPSPWTAGHATIEAQIWVDGHITWQGQPHVWLVDLTSPKVNPITPPERATHTISFKNVKAGGNAVQFPEMDIRIAPDAPGYDPVTNTVDLTLASPVPTSSGTPIVVGPRGTGVTDASIDGGNLVLTLDDGTEIDAGELPVGPGGSDAGVAGYVSTPASETSAAVADLIEDLTAALFAALDARVTALENNEPPPGPLAVEDLVNSWWCQPRALRVDDKVYVGGVGQNGNVAIASFDTTTQTTGRIQLGMTAPDDHNVPAFLIEPDLPPIVAYCGHDQFSNVRVRIGSAPGNVASLATATEVEVPVGGGSTYVMLFRRPGTNTLGMITRVTGIGTRLFVSTDWGTTWTASASAQLVASAAYVTMRVTADGTQAMFALGDHPISITNVSLQWCRADLATGTLYTPAGGVQATGNLWTHTTPASPLFPFAGTFFARRDLDADSSYTGWADSRLNGTNTSRLLDVGWGGNIAAVRMNRATPGAGGVYGVYRFRTTNVGTPPSSYNPDATQRGWTFEPIVASGVPVGFEASGYVGGMAFGTTDDTVYLVRENAGVWTLERWDKAGGVWSHTETLDTRSDGTKLGRPQVPWGTPGSVTAVHYDHYNVSGYTNYSGRQLLYP